jgi:hypothetical protein
VPAVRALHVSLRTNLEKQATTLSVAPECACQTAMPSPVLMHDAQGSLRDTTGHHPVVNLEHHASAPGMASAGAHRRSFTTCAGSQRALAATAAGCVRVEAQIPALSCTICSANSRSRPLCSPGMSSHRALSHAESMPHLAAASAPGGGCSPCAPPPRRRRQRRVG